MTGPFPPPVHGMAVATERLAAMLGARFTVRRFDIAARQHTGARLIDVLLRVSKATWMLLSFACLVLVKRPGVVVTALSAGHANAFDLACVTVSVVARRRVYITHHSFALFDGRARSRLLQFARPLLRRCFHIALCEHMKSQLCVGWGLDPARVAVLSNAALVEDRSGGDESSAAWSLRAKTPFHMGFISNLCADKGLWTFLDVVDRLQAAGHAVRATIAGPVEPADAALQRALEQRLGGMRDVAWLGAVHGDARTRFYRQLDLLVFPTVYVNESEPLVILEALAHGVPVIATPRGCIASSLADGIAVRTLPEEHFAHAAAVAVSAELRQPSTPRSDQKSLAIRHFRRLREAGALQFEALIAEMGFQPAR
jgi:glycosyltransferase involved in cell wall biosynthesis